MTIARMPGDLYYGDNLEVLRNKIASESVDLIYLDPPFNSDRTYNLIHKGSIAQEHAFVDTWTWDDNAARAYEQLTGHAPATVRVPQELSDMMVALKTFLWREHRDTLAYLSMMAIRLVEMHRVLRPIGSLYLHCDPTASHYLKLVLDAIFGMDNFRSEIVWKRQSAHSSARRYGPVHDVLFFYTKSGDYTWNEIFVPYNQKYLDAFYTHVDPDGRRWRRSDLTGAGIRHGETGNPWRGIDVTAKGRHWCKPPADLEKMDAAGSIHWPAKAGGMPMLKRYLESQPGVSLQDIWTDIKLPHNLAAERTGYATQKPLDLLARIIQSSSKPGDLVLDPFCGCGTTVEAAETLGRKWIGIDVAIRAVDVIKTRLDEKFGARVWTEYGEPADIDQAAHLAKNPYDFQWWAVRELGGSPPKGEKKKGGDGGIDGELTLRDDGGAQRHGIISVKAGHTLTPDMVKALESTVRIEKADFGVLVTMYEPSRGMRDMARDFGSVPWAPAHEGKLAHRIRIVTAPEILSKQVRFPGKNQTPRRGSAPPPPEAREGETLHLPFQARVPAGIKGSPTKVKKSDVTARGKRSVVRTKEYEMPKPQAESVAEKGSEPPKK